MNSSREFETRFSDLVRSREPDACVGNFLLTSQSCERLYAHSCITYRLLPSVYLSLSDSFPFQEQRTSLNTLVE